MRHEEYIESCTELQLFGVIYSLGDFLFYTRHDLADGNLKSTPELEEALVKSQERIKSAVQKTSRFGVNTGEIKPSKEYWAWYYRVKKQWESLKQDEKVTLLEGWEM